MVKKKRGKKKKPAKKRALIKPLKTKEVTSLNMNKMLVQNFISLQSVMVNLSKKFDELSTQIANLLDVFEISAKALAEKGVKIPTDRNSEEILKRLENLSEQNKLIAKGVTLMHQSYSHPPQPYSQFPQQVPMRNPQQNPNARIQGYQRSISSTNERP